MQWKTNHLIPTKDSAEASRIGRLQGIRDMKYLWIQQHLGFTNRNNAQFMCIWGSEIESQVIVRDTGGTFRQGEITRIDTGRDIKTCN